jgi:predicted glycosyltransferase involved in capsule biosynthesis
MLSILIPAYNFDVNELVAALYEQSKAAGIAFEIRCYDDGSPKCIPLQNELREKDEIIYQQLASNVGRSKIRNLLANDAQYEYLLFMDCDSQVTSDQYISNYIKQLDPDKLIYGGRSYTAQPPSDSNKYLRWFYGVNREVFDTESRKKNPHKSFMTNNFLIPKAIYQSIGLNEELTGYGHEDTLFGQALKERKIPIVHIDNPLCHIGLEDAKEFLHKTREGLSNLLFLINRNMADPDIKLYRYYRLLKRSKLDGLILRRFEKTEKELVNNLTSDQPSLKKFDWYKIGYLLQLESQRKSA